MGTRCFGVSTEIGRVFSRGLTLVDDFNRLCRVAHLKLPSLKIIEDNDKIFRLTLFSNLFHISTLLYVMEIVILNKSYAMIIY